MHFLYPFLLAAFGRSRKKLAISGWPLLAALVVKGLKLITYGKYRFVHTRNTQKTWDCRHFECNLHVYIGMSVCIH